MNIKPLIFGTSKRAIQAWLKNPATSATPDKVEFLNAVSDASAKAKSKLENYRKIVEQTCNTKGSGQSARNRAKLNKLLSNKQPSPGQSAINRARLNALVPNLKRN